MDKNSSEHNHNNSIESTPSRVSNLISELKHAEVLGSPQLTIQLMHEKFRIALQPEYLRAFYHYNATEQDTFLLSMLIEQIGISIELLASFNFYHIVRMLDGFNVLVINNRLDYVVSEDYIKRIENIDSYEVSKQDKILKRISDDKARLLLLPYELRTSHELINRLIKDSEIDWITDFVKIAVNESIEEAAGQEFYEAYRHEMYTWLRLFLKISGYKKQKSD